MAKDDYHVLAYRILTYLYQCLKEGAVPDLDYIGYEALGIEESYWHYIMLHLLTDEMIEGASKFNLVGRSKPLVKLTSDIMVTPKGIEFMQNNSAMKRAYDFLKSVKEIIPGL